MWVLFAGDGDAGQGEALLINSFASDPKKEAIVKELDSSGPVAFW